MLKRRRSLKAKASKKDDSWYTIKPTKRKSNKQAAKELAEAPKDQDGFPMFSSQVEVEADCDLFFKEMQAQSAIQEDTSDITRQDTTLRLLEKLPDQSQKKIRLNSRIIDYPLLICLLRVLKPDIGKVIIE